MYLKMLNVYKRMKNHLCKKVDIKTSKEKK